MSSSAQPLGAAASPCDTEPADERRAARGRLPARRWLDGYPRAVVRTRLLVLAALVMVAANYQISAGDVVAQRITARFHMGLQYYAWTSVVGAAFGALLAFAGGLADRWGRYPVIGVGLLADALLVLYAIPHASGRTAFAALTVLVSVVAGVVMVAAAAVARDFSRGGRATAMSLWLAGTVVGREIAVQPLAPHSGWTSPYQACGVASLIVWAAALVGLRDLDPAVRARAADADARPSRGRHASEAPPGRRPRVTRLRLIVVTIAMSGFLLAYYVGTALFTVQYTAISDLGEAHGPGVTGWYWLVVVAALLLAGVLSDLLRVRKPLVVVGVLLSTGSIAVFATRALHPIGFATFTLLMVGFVVGGAVAYAAGTAAFTETVERRSPSAVAGGLAMFVAIQRMIVAVPCALLPAAFLTYSPLVTGALRAQAIAAQYPTQMATLQALKPATAVRLRANPKDPQAQAEALAEVGARQGLTTSDVRQVMTVAHAYKPQLATLAKIDPATVSALRQNVNDPAAQNQALADVSDRALTADDVARLRQIWARYPAQVATLASVDQTTLAALLRNPADQAAQNQALADVSGGTLAAADVARLRQISTTYPGQLATLESVDPATLAALLRNPADQAAQNQALADVSGGALTVDDVAHLRRLSVQYAPQVATLSAIDAATVTALTGPNPSAAVPTAVSEIAAAFSISPADAQTRLMAVAQIPAADRDVIRAKAPALLAALAKWQAVQAIPATDKDVVRTKAPALLPAVAKWQAVQAIPVPDMTVIRTKAPAAVAAAGQLQAVLKVPPADLHLIESKGPPVLAAGAKLQAATAVPVTDLKTLQRFGTNLEQTVASVPSILKKAALVGAAAPIALLAVLPLLVGRWSPRRAWRDARRGRRAVSG